MNFFFKSSWWFCNRCKHICIFGHVTNIIVGCQIIGLIWDLTASDRNVFGTEKTAYQQDVSIYGLFRQISLPNSPFTSVSLSLEHCWLAHFLLAHFSCQVSSFPSFFPFIWISSHPKILHIHPHSCGLSPGRQAFRLWAQMVLWRVNQLWVSEQAGRPFCGWYGGGRSWHLLWLWSSRGKARLAHREQCQYTADWGDNCGRTITHRHFACAILLPAARWCDKYDTEIPLSWFEFIF